MHISEGKMENEIRPFSFENDEVLCSEAERSAFLDTDSNVSDEQVHASLNRIKK
jgi:hypothetical protein